MSGEKCHCNRKIGRLEEGAVKNRRIFTPKKTKREKLALYRKQGEGRCPR